MPAEIQNIPEKDGLGLVHVFFKFKSFCEIL